MTYAEASIHGGRDDDHMIYEEYNISQYTDGSVLNCLTMTTYTAQDVIDGTVSMAGLPPLGDKHQKAVAADLRRNAKKAYRKVA
jgi:hypothetical protein